MNNTLVRFVIGIRKKSTPFRIGDLLNIHSKTMVLRRDEAAFSPLVNAWLVHTTIAVLHLVRSESSGQCQQLVTEANAKDWFGARCEYFAKIGNGLATLGGITGSVADEETVVLGRIQWVVPRYEIHSSAS